MTQFCLTLPMSGYVEYPKKLRYLASLAFNPGYISVLLTLVLLCWFINRRCWDFPHAQPLA